MRRSASFCTVALLFLVLTREAKAQAERRLRVYHPSPRVNVFTSLRYERGPGAEVCPGEQAVRALFVGRLGHDPFEPDAEGVSVGETRVFVAKSRDGFVARYEWTGSHGVERSVFRASGSSSRDCREALEGVAVGLATLFLLREIAYAEELGRKREAPMCSASPRPAPLCFDSRFSVWPAEWPLAPLEKPKASPVEAPAHRPWAMRLGAAVWPEVIVAGWGSLGLSVDIGVRWRWLSASAELHGDPPLGSVLVRNVGAVSFARLSGELLLCAHWGWFVGCGVGDAGRFFFPHHVSALPASAFYGGAGVRAGLEFPVVAARVFLRTSVGVLAPIQPASYSTARGDIFKAAGPSAGLGFGLVVEMPP